MRGCEGDAGGGTRAGSLPCQSPADLRRAARVTGHAAGGRMLQTRDASDLPASCPVHPLRLACDPLGSFASAVSLPPPSTERWKGNSMMGHHQGRGEEGLPAFVADGLPADSSLYSLRLRGSRGNDRDSSIATCRPSRSGWDRRTCFRAALHEPAGHAARAPQPDRHHEGMRSGPVRGTVLSNGRGSTRV